MAPPWLDERTVDRRATGRQGGRAPRHRASLSLAHHLPRMIARAAGMALVIATAVSLTAADSNAPGVAVSFAILASGSPLRWAAASPGGESAHETASLLGSSYASVRLGRMMHPRIVVGIAAKAPALKTDDDAGRTDAYLAGQTGVLLEKTPDDGAQDKHRAGQTGVLPGAARQEDLPLHLRDYRHGQTGVLLDHQSEL